MNTPIEYILLGIVTLAIIVYLVIGRATLTGD